MSLVSLREFARRRGVALSTVQRKIARGIIPVRRTESRGRGKIVLVDLEEATAAWDTGTDQLRQPSPTRGEMGAPDHASRGVTLDSLPVSMFPEQPETGLPDHGAEEHSADPEQSAAAKLRREYQSARSEREKLAVEAAKLSLDERAGRLVRADDVRLAHFNQGARLQRQFLAIPARVAAAVVAAISEEGSEASAHAQILAILDAEIKSAIRTICENERAHVNRNNNKTEGGENGANVDIS